MSITPKELKTEEEWADFVYDALKIANNFLKQHQIRIALSNPITGKAGIKNNRELIEIQFIAPAHIFMELNGYCPHFETLKRYGYFTNKEKFADASPQPNNLS